MAVQLLAKSAELGEARAAAKSQLDITCSRLAQLDNPERSNDAFVSHYASLMPSHLQELSPEERRHI